MSRVFVSCAYRDRVVGERLGDLVRSLGHDSASDQDDAQGTVWWNEVVGRIEASDVFVAVASSAYAEAQACRLAAKHAAATGLPVVRVDLDRRVAPDCHPVVAQAVGVPFAPEDPEAVVRLAHALMGSPPEVRNGAAAPVPAPRPAREETAREPSAPRAPEPSSGHVTGLELGMAFVILVSAIGLLYVALSLRGDSDPSPGAKPGVSGPASATPTPGATPSAAEPTDAAAAALVSAIGAADSTGLPVGSCQAGADVVTCTNPATNIHTVVLTPFQTPAELYAAYTAQVESMSGESFQENTGNCSSTESRGEVGWNLNAQHTLDFTVDQHVVGGLHPVTESAGRVSCTSSQGVMQLVWTQDPGLLVTVTGQESSVVDWWSLVHLQLACAGGAAGSGCEAI